MREGVRGARRHRNGYLRSLHLTPSPPVPADLRALVDRLADALGPDAPAAQVERVARAVLSARRGEGSAPAPRRALALAFGPDAPDLPDAIADAVADAGARVLEASAQRLGGFAALLLLVDLGGGTTRALEARLRACPGCTLAAVVPAAG